MGPKTVSDSYCQLHVCASTVNEDKSNVSCLLVVYVVYILVLPSVT